MSEMDYTRNLFETLGALRSAMAWLERSMQICASMPLEGEISAEDHDAFEAFTSRFARAGDVLVQKVLRALDAVELEDGGTLIDAVNRAEKRGLIDSVEQLREIRELRNEIAHEYALQDLRNLFADVRKFSPQLVAIAQRVDLYCRRYAKP